MWMNFTDMLSEDSQKYCILDESVFRSSRIGKTKIKKSDLYKFDLYKF